jgi:hypothetical protein
MKVILMNISLVLVFLTSCYKQEIPKRYTYTASYTINTNVCPENYGFRIKGSTSSLSKSYTPNQNDYSLDLELAVILCNSISSSNLPQTIPAIIYRNNEIFLQVDLIRSAPSNSAEANRTYFYHFRHHQ